MKLIPLGLILGLGAWFVAAAPCRAVEAGEALGSYKVVKGDCLWTIAAKDSIYGNPWVWPLLLDHNQDKIDNPDLIYPGWKLKHPLSPSALRISRAKQYASYYGEESPWPAMASVPPLMAGKKDVAALQPMVPFKAEGKPQNLGRVSGPLFLALAMLGLAVMGMMIVFMRKKAKEMPPEMAAPEAPKAPALYVAQPTESEEILKAEKMPEIHEEEEHKKAA